MPVDPNWDRGAFGDHPSEDELLTHLVVPLLRALGWPVERIAIKWRYVDACVFRQLPRRPEHCHFVIEAKRLGAGVEGALEQAKGYVFLDMGNSRNVVGQLISSGFGSGLNGLRVFGNG